MKKLTGFILLSIIFIACKKSRFGDYYVEPAASTETTIEKQWAGANASFKDYEFYKYWNYFVILQNTLLHYTQASSYTNSQKRYEPGAQASGDRWSAYYAFVAQYKEFLKVYNVQSAEVQKAYRVFKISTDIHFFDQTQKVIDLHGDIPWTNAGLLSTNDGNYSNSFATYDNAKTIYTTMLDSLKNYATELNTIVASLAANPNDGTMNAVIKNFKQYDFINSGDISLWIKYCNSLRIRMLTRISNASDFQTRSASEIAAILADPATYPICTENSDNIMIDVTDNSNDKMRSDLYSGIIGWGNNDIPTKGMIDLMVQSSDPRLRCMFQPGGSAPANTYKGLDLTLDAGAQTTLIDGGTLSRYNFGLTKSHALPGILITAAEVQLLLADYYLNIAGNDASAKTAYENAIKSSIDFYYHLRNISDNQDASAGSLNPTNDTEKDNYINNTNISWTQASTKDQKNVLIANQKWLNYSIFQPNESWAEMRRTNLPNLSFTTDASSSLSPQPPVRLFYPADEKDYNTANYEAVKANDNLTTKIFWDIN